MEHMYVVEHNPRYGDGWQICDDYLFRTSEDALKYVEYLVKIYMYENMTVKYLNDGTIAVDCGENWMCTRFMIKKWRISDGVFN